MASFQPKVLEDIDLESFIQHLLDNHGASSTVIVCEPKDSFIQHLQASILESTRAHQPEPATAQSDTEHEPVITEEQPATKQMLQPHRWTIPILRLLASAQTLKLAFCEDVTHFRAYLAAYAYRNPSDASTVMAQGQDQSSMSPARVLAICNPIALHRETSSFSAQGLNRTLSIAVDAAHTSGSKLMIAECRVVSSRQSGDDEAMREDGEPTALRIEGSSVWDEEVSTPT